MLRHPILVYEEAHCGFQEPHAFLLICKSNTCKEQWYSNTDVIDYQIYERIAKTKSGERGLFSGVESIGSGLEGVLMGKKRNSAMSSEKKK